MGKHSWERRKVIYSEAELGQISDYSNKCLTFLTHFLERDSGLRNKVSKLRSLIISAFKMTWWLVGVLKVYARNSLASQGSRVEADKITWGTGAACLTPLALSSENISSWHEDESSSLWKSWKKADSYTLRLLITTTHSPKHRNPFPLLQWLFSGFFIIVDSLSDQGKGKNFFLISSNHQIAAYLWWNHICHTENCKSHEGF